MKYFFILSCLLLTSCMTASLNKSTLPQTGASGKLNPAMLSGEPRPGLREISYKRHLTRSVQGTQDTVRVMLFVDPYLKLNAKVQAEAEGAERGYNGIQIDDEYQKIYVNNMKAWVQSRTCFDFEINSDTAEAGEAENWDVELKSLDGGGVMPVLMQFSPEHLTGRGGKWYQFTGVMCAATRVEPHGGLQMTLVPKYRSEPRPIVLTWDR